MLGTWGTIQVCKAAGRIYGMYIYMLGYMGYIYTLGYRYTIAKVPGYGGGY